MPRFFLINGGINIFVEKANLPTPVVTSGLNLDDPNFDYSIHELNALAKANGMKVVGTTAQELDHPYAGTYFGPGKIKSIRSIMMAQKAEYLIVNDELTPSQIRNLEKMTGKSIIDRTGLILEIFANRARTKGAKLQVKLAQLEYQLPRLRTSASVRLDQQTGTGGGSYTNRGAGETLIEMKRRTLAHGIYNIRHHLKSVAKTDQVQRTRRRQTGIPNVALVGYTNAGKSTLMNQLVRKFGQNEDKQVKVKNMLFATLSTEVRKLTLPNQMQFMLSDTVGFVSKLPHQLVSAFRATLSEAAHADLLIQVVDYSSPNRQLMMNTTQKTLKAIGIKNKPMLIIFNKADRTNTDYPVQEGNALITSVKNFDSKSIHFLIKMIKHQLYRNYVTAEFLIPFTQGQITAYLNHHANVIKTKYSASGTHLKVQLPKAIRDRFAKYLITN